MTIKNAHQWISIGELAKRSGVSVSAVRFYEDRQLIWSVRTEGNQRRYQRAMLRRVAIIKVAQQVGVSLERVKIALDTLPKDRVPSSEDWQVMSQQWQADLDKQILGLLKLRLQLDKCIGCGCLSVKQCPLRNPEDQCGEQITGQHYQDTLSLLLKQELVDSLEIHQF
ncbi:redox-sensitive transcriptional activator SoxR [Acinetobacter rudis]|uniref:Redox-sensitive transcriptional activator SoxR n=1 Tax=Acinetobacter rudis TaxID=632955 RepID=A0AAW8J726_9GAMM|nr:redox-sensitive transcriptional activator SoxR [Acinetobacter rudis]MDQ8934907.1 redox-sensitive transcriptional activator SoxR [Acinetobacter rudis]MDQ8952866.1 redox-sensitive transcriptional activator SoxR [Acinetobacter rudis]MDQ9017308.1 redox-sensitive transcriptional activator SoxR [Acinetobacter rudis]